MLTVFVVVLCYDAAEEYRDEDLSSLVFSVVAATVWFLFLMMTVFWPDGKD